MKFNKRTVNPKINKIVWTAGILHRREHTVHCNTKLIFISQVKPYLPIEIHHLLTVCLTVVAFYCILTKNEWYITADTYYIIIARANLRLDYILQRFYSAMGYGMEMELFVYIFRMYVDAGWKIVKGVMSFTIHIVN